MIYYCHKKNKRTQTEGGDNMGFESKALLQALLDAISLVDTAEDAYNIVANAAKADDTTVPNYNQRRQQFKHNTKETEEN
jgi:hypothetical protein